VDRDLDAVGGASRPGTGLADFDRPRVVQQRRDLVRGVEKLGHRRTGHAGDEIRRVVADHEQRSAGPDRGSQRGKQPGARLRRQLHELHRDQVEGAGLGRPGQQVRLPPLDACGHHRIGVAGMPGASLQRDAGNVGRDHRPPSVGQPDSVGSLAASHIQRPAGWPARDLGDELRVRVAAPDLSRRTVALVPETLVEYATGAMSMFTHLPSMASRTSATLSKQIPWPRTGRPPPGSMRGVTGICAEKPHILRRH
jgi:hypothetical protein